MWACTPFKLWLSSSFEVFVVYLMELFFFLYIAILFSTHAFGFVRENLLLITSCRTFTEEGICEVAYFSIVVHCA